MRYILIILLFFLSFNIYSQNIILEKYIDKNDFDIDSLISMQPFQIINTGNSYYMGLYGYKSPGFDFVGLLKFSNLFGIHWQRTLIKDKPIIPQEIDMINENNICIIGSYINVWIPGFYDSDGLLNLIKYDTLGNLKFDYVDSSNRRVFTEPGTFSLIFDNILGRFPHHFNNKNTDSLYVRKYDKNGILQSVKDYEILPYYNNTTDTIVKNRGFLMRTIDSNIMSYGYIHAGNSNKFPFIIKFDKNFNEIWHKIFADSPGRNIMNIKQNIDSNYFIIGWYLNSVSSKNDSSCFIWKLDKSGNLLNEKYFYGRYFTKIQFFNDNILLGGTVEQFTAKDTLGYRFLYLNSNFDIIKDYIFHYDTVYKAFGDFTISNNKIIFAGSYNYFPYIAEIDGIIGNNSVIECDCDPSTIKIFPNPFHDNIKLKIPANKAKVEIYNIYGSIIFEQDLSDIVGEASIYIQNLIDGVYIIKVKFNNIFKFAKIIKN
jgi:hypothetical protein